MGGSTDLNQHRSERLPVRLGRDGNLRTLLGLGQRDPDLAAVGRQGLADHLGGLGDRVGAAGPLHQLGTAVLACHRRLLPGSQQHRGVGLAGRAAVLQPDRRAAQRPAELLHQRPVLLVAGRLRGQRGGQRGGARVRGARFLGRDHHIRPDCWALRGPPDSRHLPDAALHHPLAGVADGPTDLGLAGRRRFLSRPVPRGAGGQSRSAHPARHRRVHHRYRAGDERPHCRHRVNAAVRGDRRDGLGGGLHPDPLEPVRPADGVRGHGGSRAVLDRAALRRRHHRGRVLDRPSADPVQLPQRTHQRRLPLCPGADARRGRVHQFLSGRAGRTCRAANTFHGDHRQLSQLRGTQPGAARVEPVDLPGHQSAAADRAGAATLQRPDHLRRRHPVLQCVQQRA